MNFFRDFRIQESKDLFGQHRPRPMVKAGAWVTLSNLSTGFWQIVCGVILARLIAPEAFGAVALVTVFYNLMTQFLGIAFASASVQKENLTEQQASNFFWLNVLCSGLMALCLALSGPWLADYYALPELAPIALVYALLMVLNGLGVQHRSLLQRSMRYDIGARMAFLVGPVGLFVSVPLAYLGFGVWAIVAQAVVGGIFTRLLLWWVVSWTPLSFRRGAGIRQMISFGGRSAFAMIVHFCYESGQSLILGKMATPAQVGFYNRGQGLFQRPYSQLMKPLLAVLLPRMSAMQSRPDEMNRFVVRTSWLIAIAIMPMLVWMSLFGEQFSIILLGEPWRTAGRVMEWFALGAFFFGLLAPLGKACAALGTPAKSIGVRVVLLPFYLWAILSVVEYGAEPVAMVYALSQLVTFPFAVILVFRRSPLDPRMILKGALQNISCSALASFFVIVMSHFSGDWLLTPSPGWYGFVKLVVGAAACYLLVLIASRAFSGGRDVHLFICRQLLNLLGILRAKLATKFRHV